MSSPYWSSYGTSGGDPNGMVYAQTQGGSGSAYDQQQAGAAYQQAANFNRKELEQKYKMSKDDIEARMKIAGIESGDRRAGIEQAREEARGKLEQQRQEMLNIGIPRVAVEKYVAEKTYEIALSEMTLKRDTLTADTAQKAAQLKLDREQMERVGIPRMEIERYTAQENARIASGRLGLEQAGVTGYYGGAGTLEQRKFLADQAAAARTAAEASRQFNTTASGYLQQQPTLTAGQQSRYQQIQARDEAIRASGGPGVDPAERAELAGYEDILAGRAPNPQQPGGGAGGQATLDRERFAADEAERQRRYGLDVSKFGAELASTPDTYFQARRFQGVDVPRLLGGAGAATTDVAGGPTPGVATMGAYLSGQDPYGQHAEAQAAPPAPGAAPAAPAAPAAQPLTAQEQARYQQLTARAHQLTAAGEPIPAVDADELQRFVARGAPAPGAGPAPAAPGQAPLSGQEQARWQQLMARDQEIRASGGPGLEGADLDEAQRFQQRGATYAAPTAALGRMPTYESPAFAGGGSPYGGAGAGGGPIDQYGNPIGGGAPGTPGGGGGTVGGGAAVTGWYDPTGQYGSGAGGYGGGGGTFDPGGYRTPGGYIQQPTFTGGGGTPRGGGFGGGGFPNVDPVTGGSTLPPSAYGGALTNSTSTYGATPYGGSSVNAAQGYASAMPAWYTQQQQGGSGAQQQDPAKRVAALAKIMPPSPFAGLNDQDSAALKAMESIYKGGGQSIAGGEYERLKSSGRMGFLQSAGKLLGYSPSDLENQYLSYRPQQGSSRMAG